MDNENITGVIPDTLLGFAKDRRYVTNLTNLLSDAISPHYYVTSTSISQGTGSIPPGADETSSCLRPEIGLLARILHACIVVNEGKSLGLDHLGLGYPQFALRIRIFSLLYAICPYILERARRNGWNDLGNIRSSLSLALGMRDGGTVPIEQLRGVERRRIYEEMRQRMLQRASEISGNGSGRAQSNDGNTGNIANMVASRPRIEFPPWKQFAVKSRQSLHKVLCQIDIACKADIPLPHDLSNQNPNDPNTNLQNNEPQRLDRFTSLMKWVIRLNLALFYANGKYPSILHRLTGLQIEKKKTNVNIRAERPTYNIVGLIILVQAAAKLTQGIVEISIDAWYARKKRIEETKPDTHSILNKIEAKVPSSESSEKQKSAQISTASNGSVHCAICMTERKHPAAPNGCGHIFCWDCIQHWIATVRQECPFCRSPTRPQDVIALYNYDTD